MGTLRHICQLWYQIVPFVCSIKQHQIWSWNFIGINVLNFWGGFGGYGDILRFVWTVEIMWTSWENSRHIELLSDLIKVFCVGGFLQKSPSNLNTTAFRSNFLCAKCRWIFGCHQKKRSFLNPVTASKFSAILAPLTHGTETKDRWDRGKSKRGLCVKIFKIIDRNQFFMLLLYSVTPYLISREPGDISNYHLS